MPAIINLIAFLAIGVHTWNPVMENENLFEGDIVLSPEQKLAEKAGKLSFAAIKTKLWTQRVIPYRLFSSLASSPEAIKAINAAMAEIQKFTCLRFVKRTTEKEYLLLYEGRGCDSPVGKSNSGINLISLNQRCWSKPVVVHELLHSLGFWHEQSRPDRDQYLSIKWENIPEDKKHNFKKQPAKNIDSLGTSYDYFSIMHYSKTAFGDGLVTMEVKNAYYSDLIGHGNTMSETDIIQLNRLYKCPEYKGKIPAPPTPQCHDLLRKCWNYMMDGLCKLDDIRNVKCPFSCGKCTTIPPV